MQIMILNQCLSATALFVGTKLFVISAKFIYKNLKAIQMQLVFDNRLNKKQLHWKNAKRNKTKRLIPSHQLWEL